MPRTLKQYFRYFLVKAGLFNEGAFKLVLDRIDQTDTFIVSFPKSGNTWLRFLIANLIEPNKEINFRNIDDVVPDVYSANKIANAKKGKRFLKVHHPYFNFYPKSIYIIRDVRDVMVSYYHYMNRLGQFNGSIDEFALRYSENHDFGTWKQHAEGAVSFSKKHPERILILKYEDMLQDPHRELTKIIEFAEINFEGDISEIISRCSFVSLQETENATGSQFKDLSNENFFRAGKMNVWQNELSESTVMMLEKENREELVHFGYNISGKSFL